MIAFDSSAIISLVEGIEPSRAQIIELVRRYQAPWIVSTVSMIECLTRPKAREKPSLRGSFETFFSSAEVSMTSVTPIIATRAAEIRSTIGLKTPDAIHLATALEHFAEAFVTTDQHFSRCSSRFGIAIHIIPRPLPRIL
jgi:predicted nucleic acid-binding protein